MQTLDIYAMKIYDDVKFPLHVNESLFLLSVLILFSFLFTSRSLEMAQNQKIILEQIECINERSKVIEESLIIIVESVNTNNSCISLLGDTVQHLCSNQERTTDICQNITNICTDINNKSRFSAVRKM